MVDVTFSIEAEDLKAARTAALQNGTSLNAVIGAFIKNYVGQTQCNQNQGVVDKILQSMYEFNYAGESPKGSRDELYER